MEHKTWNFFASCPMIHAPCLVNILGVRVDNLNKKEILEKIEAFFIEDGFHQIATVNPEFILEAQKNEKFKSILNKCDLNIADGIGLKYAFLRHFSWLKTRIAGADLMHEILKIANKRGLNVFLAINKSGLSSCEEIILAIKKLHPELKIDGEEVACTNLNYKLPTKNYQLIFCNFGAPHQELFINSVKNDSIRLAMGVGGTFDFVTGKIKRAPKVMRFFGLEWLYRLTQEPKYRLGRIFRAVIVFPLRIIINI